MSWSVRADAWAALEPLRERVVNCLEYVRAAFFSAFSVKKQLTCALAIVYPHFFLNRSGANATGCRHEIMLGERYLDLHQNPVLGE